MTSMVLITVEFINIPSDCIMNSDLINEDLLNPDAIFLLGLIWINLYMTSMVNHNFMEMIALNKFRGIQKRVLSR